MELYESAWIPFSIVDDVSWEPWVPPRTGSKRYQRRRAQRWPKGK